jgi:glutathione synthase/RimK-type ligase-like ATP-grasp enzyme
MKVAILRDNNPDSSAKWESACKKQNLPYQVVNMLQNDWYKKIIDFAPDFCISRPPGDVQKNKKVFDDKLFFIEKHIGLQVFPSYNETVIYENKASLAYFLKVSNINHPETFVSYSQLEAKEFVEKVTYPIVAKTLMGAAGSGVKIIKSHSEASEYIKKAFTSGIKRRYGPNRKTGSPKNWAKKAIKSPAYLLKKLKEYGLRDNDIQRGVVLFQEYIEHDYEWRCAMIGESYFAYKKLRVGSQASGSKEFEYGPPPIELLDFTRSLNKKFGFNFMAVDLFYNAKGIFVNELQTIFGHKNPYICKVNGKPGRYIYQNNQWYFEEGNFNTNESYDLRLETAIKLYENTK